MHIVLYQPEIPPNTGNIARLCAATQIPLHLIEPLGFSLEDKYLKRAGLDYWKYVKLTVWSSLDDYLQADGKHRRLVMTSARGGTPVHSFTFSFNDTCIFGRETAGLPKEVLQLSDQKIRIPIYHTVRSLNLSTSAGIIVYYALSCTGMIDSID